MLKNYLFSIFAASIIISMIVVDVSVIVGQLNAICLIAYNGPTLLAYFILGPQIEKWVANKEIQKDAKQ